jgi:hypothetical protein
MTIMEFAFVVSAIARVVGAVAMIIPLIRRRRR